MTVNWDALWKVAEVSIGATVGIVLLFTLAALTNVMALHEGRGLRRTTHQVAAGLCYSACVSAVCYGIILIVPQLHR